MSRPFQPSGMASAAHGRGLRLGREVVGHHHVGGQHDLARLQQPPAVVDLLALQQRVADPVALRGQEGEAHPAADQQRVDLRQQRVDHRQLVGDLGAAEHHGVGPLRVLGEPAQHLDLGQHQPAGVGRQRLGDLVHRGLLAVHHPEPVGDERPVRPRSARPARRPARPARRRSCWSRAGRSGCSRPARRRRRPCSAARRPAATSRTGAPEQLTQPGARPAPASTSGPARPWAGRGAR